MEHGAHKVERGGNCHSVLPHETNLDTIDFQFTLKGKSGYLLLS